MCVLDDLSRCVIELRRSKLRYCQHKDYELSYECIENEASVTTSKWKFE